MTSIVESRRNPAWRGRLVWIALALSLTLNLCVIVGLVWERIHPPLPPMMRVERLLRPLALDPAQHRALEEFMRSLRLHGRFMRESDQALTGDLWSELAKPTPDSATITDLTGQITENRQTFQHEASSALGGFVKTLTPEQRAQLAAIAKAPPDEMTRRLFDFILPQ